MGVEATISYIKLGLFWNQKVKCPKSEWYFDQPLLSPTSASSIITHLNIPYGNWSKRRQTETSTTKTSTNRNVDKPKRDNPKRRQAKTSTDQNVDKPKRRQTKTSTSQNVDRPKRRQTKTSTNQNVHRPKYRHFIVVYLFS